MGLVLDRVGEGAEGNHRRQRRGEIGGEAGEVTAPTTDDLGKRYGTFSGWGLAAGKVE